MKEIKIVDLPGVLQKNYDIFITSASFEERSLSIVRTINSKINFSHKFVIAELSSREYIEDNLNKFTQEFGFTIIDVDKLDQLKTVDNFLKIMGRVLIDNPYANFLLDITSFTRQNLLLLLRLLRNNLSKKYNKVECIYALAADYAIGLPEDEKWLSKGVLQVQSVFGYAGTMVPSKPYHLIIMMGYEVERAASLIDAYEPSKVTIGFASKNSSLSSSYFELNKKRYESLLNMYPFAEHFEFSCSNFNCIDTILEQSHKYPEHNVVISPMNNKISTLCLAISSFINTGIQIAIAVPILYNYKGYSSPGDNCIIVDASEKILK